MEHPRTKHTSMAVSKAIGRVSIPMLIMAIAVLVLPLPGQAQGKHKGTAVLAGGGIGSARAAILEEIVAKAGGGEGNICVVPVSSYPWNWDLRDCIDLDGLSGEAAIACADDFGWRYGNSKINIDYYGQILEEYGIGRYTGVYIDPTIREESHNPELVEAVNTCTGFFFTGGDQSRGIYALRDDRGKASPVLKAIQKKIKKGAVMTGTSAGTAIQTKRFVIANGYLPVALTEGASPAVWDAVEEELVFDGGVCDSCDNLLFNQFQGVGNFKYGITDTHFSDRERTMRLLRLVADSRRTFGFGIDTATSLNVDNGIMTVIGQDGVTILDLTRARVNRRSDGFNIKGVRISYIRPGDTYNAKKRRFALGGAPIEEVDTAPITHEDIMDEQGGDGFRMVALLSDLAASARRVAVGYSHSTSPQYRVTLIKKSRTQTAVHADGRVSVANMWMRVDTVK